MLCVCSFYFLFWFSLFLVPWQQNYILRLVFGQIANKNYGRLCGRRKKKAFQKWQICLKVVVIVLLIKLNELQSSHKTTQKASVYKQKVQNKISGNKILLKNQAIVTMVLIK